MLLSDRFDYFLPYELIAQKPILPRDHCRLMVLLRKEKKILHKPFFYQIVDFFKKGDVLVLNNTKVFKARIFGFLDFFGKNASRVEILFLKPVDDFWEVLGKPGKKLKIGRKIFFDSKIAGEVIGRQNEKFLLKINLPPEKVIKWLDKKGQTPTPPYIEKSKIPLNLYQTTYAQKVGSVAAPTAGLHFTKKLLKTLKKKGVQIVFITLHVGYGTFKPIKSKFIEEHKMEEEFVEISKRAAFLINQAKKEKRRVFAVGTTVVRALEGVALTSKESPGLLSPFRGLVNLFIYPGFKFKVIDGLITNFHLPKSTLLLLVSAFAGINLIKKAYQEAIRQKYRFYSFGDAMLIL